MDYKIAYTLHSS